MIAHHKRINILKSHFQFHFQLLMRDKDILSDNANNNTETKKAKDSLE